MYIPINKTISKTTYTTFALLEKLCSHSTNPGDINAALGHLEGTKPVHGRANSCLRPKTLEKLQGMIDIGYPHREERGEGEIYVLPVPTRKCGWEGKLGSQGWARWGGLFSPG